MSSPRVTNVIAKCLASATNLLTTFCSYFSTILNYLQQEYNTMKWSVYLLVSLPSQCHNTQQFEYFIILINEAFPRSLLNIL